VDNEILKSLVTVLLIGFMIGLQRALSSIRKNEPGFMGSRTFALIALLGYLSGWIGESVEYFSLLSFIVVSLFIAMTYVVKVKKINKLGITTQISAIITYLLGLMVYLGLDRYAIFIAVLVIVLLEIKPKLQELEQKISPKDVHSVILLLVMTFVILPILPDRMIGPYHLFNPYKTWLMAVIIASISFIGYVAIKVLGHKHGIFITGAAGGLISSTAVTITLAQMYRTQRRFLKNYAGGIAIACTFMYLRVLFEAMVINVELAAKLSIPYLLASISGLLYSYYLYKHSQNADINLENEAISKNPLQLSEAIKFGLLFGIIYGAIAFVEQRYGEIGVYIVSFLSGITDVDAVTLSLSEMAKEGGLDQKAAMAGIVIASVTNSIVKWGLAFWIGGKELGWELGKFFVLTLSLMGAGLFLALRFFQ